MKLLYVTVFKMFWHQIIEEKVDAEIERLDNLDGDELENLRKERMAAMRKRALKKNEWIANVCIVFVYYISKLK